MSRWVIDAEERLAHVQKKKTQKERKRKLNRARIGSQDFFFFFLHYFYFRSLGVKTFSSCCLSRPPLGPQEAHFGYSYVSGNMLGRGPRWQFLLLRAYFAGQNR